MKLSQFTSFVVAAVALIVCAVSPARAQWHSWSQGQRNSAILNRALVQNGSYTGVECKVWVQNVVSSASGGVVWLPQNQPNQYQWYPSSDAWAVPYCPAIYSAVPGSVIQMKWNNTLHTAIVYSQTSNGMYWIDCNWQNDRVVRMHHVSYTDFFNATRNLYTVYYVR